MNLNTMAKYTNESGLVEFVRTPNPMVARKVMMKPTRMAFFAPNLFLIIELNGANII